MLTSLSLENFRNYEKYSLDFDRTTILVGPNGAGKTNILEAIYLLSTGRSWRTRREARVIKWEADLARIKAEISINHPEVNYSSSEPPAGGESRSSSRRARTILIIEMLIQRAPLPDYPQAKIIKINSVKKRPIELIGHLPTVLFSPEEIGLISGAPALRRRFLDIILCQINRLYTAALQELFQVIRSRNKLLYYIKIGQSQIDELFFWDEKLIDLGGLIIKARQGLIDEMNRHLTKNYQTISAGKEILKIKYAPKVLPVDFKKNIEQYRLKEIEKTATLIGPHRDDIVFLLSERNLAAFGSRGEERSAILALKMAELAFLRDKAEREPILLLDDIFSELDAARRGHLAKIIEGQQTIITTTDLDHIGRGLRGEAKIIELV